MDELERHLRRYRPVGPSHELRGRILNARRSRVWGWLPAAVAAVLAITFSSLGANVQRQVAEQLSAAQTSRAEVADALAVSLGGDVLTRQTGQLQILSELLVAAESPWPQRIDRIAGVARLPAWYARAGEGARAVLESVATFAAQQIARVRCQILMIAVERYKRDHAERLPDELATLVPAYLSTVPIDPFTGTPLRMVKDNDGYSVYSVNTNGRDDGGQLGDGSDAGRYAADLGVRIQPR